MDKTKVKIGKAINGISINGIEYLLDNDQREMIFENRESAKQFLRENGYEDFSDEEMEDTFIFEEVKE